MVPQPYVDGITGTVTRSFASGLTAGQITVAEDTGQHLGGLPWPLAPGRRHGGRQP